MYFSIHLGIDSIMDLIVLCTIQFRGWCRVSHDLPFKVKLVSCSSVFVILSTESVCIINRALVAVAMSAIFTRRLITALTNPVRPFFPSLVNWSPLCGDYNIYDYGAASLSHTFLTSWRVLVITISIAVLSLTILSFFDSPDTKRPSVGRVGLPARVDN